VAGACSDPETRWSTCNWSERQSRADHPINSVDWSQADAYCKWRGSRLPTEAEWIASAQGVGQKSVDTCAKRDDSGTCTVGSHPEDASQEGIVDLFGNVKEWTDTKEMLPGDVEARVIRGTGWHVDPLAAAPDNGLTNRETLVPTTLAADLGFRCVSTR
jgi:formylglycine-generating enzyme required for sulfatase activity